MRVWCDDAMVGREKKYLDPDLGESVGIVLIKRVKVVRHEFFPGGRHGCGVWGSSGY